MKIPENRQITASRITMFAIGIISIFFSIYRGDMVAHPRDLRLGHADERDLPRLHHRAVVGTVRTRRA